MSQRNMLFAVAAVSLALTVGFGGAAVYNASQPVVPAADGVTIGGSTIGQWLNWLIAASGGLGTIVSLIAAALVKVNPNLGPVIDLGAKMIKSDVGDQILAMVSPFIAAVDDNPANDVPIPFHLKRPLKNGDVEISVVWTPRAKAEPAK